MKAYLIVNVSVFSAILIAFAFMIRYFLIFIKDIKNLRNFEQEDDNRGDV